LEFHEIFHEIPWENIMKKIRLDFHGKFHALTERFSPGFSSVERTRFLIIEISYEDLGSLCKH
jgi:hypothetical protein